MKCFLLYMPQLMQYQPQQQLELPAIALHEIVSIKKVGGADMVDCGLWEIAILGIVGEKQSLSSVVYPLRSSSGVNR